MDGPGRVLVIGGGIAGLGVARALRAQDVECEVVERASSWQHPGAGMYLPANSVRALDALGLRTALLDQGREIARQRFLDHRGRPLFDVDLPSFWGETGPCVALSRRALHEVLRDGLDVRMAATVVDLRHEGGRIQAVFGDGSSGDYDLAIGADGVHSWVRATAFAGRARADRAGAGRASRDRADAPGRARAGRASRDRADAAEPHFLSQVSWRLLIDGVTDVDAWTVWLGHGRSFLVIPLGGDQVYCYADLDTAGTSDPTGGDPAALAELFADFAEPVPTILAAGLATGAAPYFSPIEEVVQEPWVSGRIALLGDAAHAMSPNMAEGAGLALEDALVLAETIASGASLAAFEARRRPRVAFVSTQTHRRDRTRRLPSSMRNASLRLAGQQIFRSNYAALRSPL